MTVGPASPEYLKWSEVSITVDRRDDPDFIPTPGRYPLIISPIIKDNKINRVLVDGGSSINILFLKTIDQMGLPRMALQSCRVPLRGIVPSAIVTLVGQITLPVTFETQENFRMDYM
jgi:hypothetical protein